MKTILCAVLAGLAIVPGGFLAAGRAADDAGGMRGKVAPVWSLADVDGKTVASADFKGKVVVIDFWATWCGPCRQEIPGYVALQKKYTEQGVVFVGVSLDQKGPAAVKEFIQKNGMNYRVVMGDEAVVNAFGGIDAIPTTFIIGRDGKVIFSKVGAMPEPDFEKELRKAL